ncbi:MAG: Rpn family recombination-promoting nuclease/putative transposase [Magnetococcales bacterium]|nr:Rpn family recombination-promoting nuclease/putative transposase [Magnetococcales bacterium]
MKRHRSLISFDWALKRLLRSKANFDVLEGLLSELLMTDVQIVELLESESNKEDPLDKYNRVDMKIRNTQGEIILIELQYEREYDYLQRMIYGVAKTITEHMREGDPYAKIQKVISISILYFDLGAGSDYVYHGTTSFKGLHTQEELLLNEGQKKMFNRQTIQDIFPELYLIKVSRFNDVARDPLDEWIYFLKNAEIRENFTARGLKKAKEVLDILRLSEEERNAYERYQEDLHFQASMVESTWVAGKIEGEIIGEQRGIQIGEQRGEQRGEAKILIRQLQRRFGALPAWASEAIAKAEPPALETWSLRILEAQSLDELFANRP